MSAAFVDYRLQLFLRLDIFPERFNDHSFRRHAVDKFPETSYRFVLQHGVAYVTRRTLEEKLGA